VGLSRARSVGGRDGTQRCVWGIVSVAARASLSQASSQNHTSPDLHNRRAGLAAGLQEGRELGLQKGFEIGAELGWFVATRFALHANAARPTSSFPEPACKDQTRMQPLSHLQTQA